MRIGYFVHDLGDAAVARRVTMLQRGGAEVALAGFHRTATPPADVAGVAPIPLGHTADGKLAARAMSVVGRRMSAARIAAVDAAMVEVAEIAAADVSAATDVELRRVHSPGYVRRVLALDGEHGQLDYETVISPSSVTARITPKTGAK